MKDEEPVPQGHMAQNLLADWRAAERDTVAAKQAVRVAELALNSAQAAEVAAAETEAAAQAAVDAVTSAARSAERARVSANLAAEAARVLTAGAEGEMARATHEVDLAEGAETAARDRFHEAQARDFKKESGSLAEDT